MVEKTWGSAQEVPWNAKRLQVANDAEIGKGNYAYVDFIPQNTDYTLPVLEYWNVINGDLSYIKNDVETKLSGSKVVWIRLSWTSSSIGGLGGNFYGFRAEILAKNVDAGMTGLEIAVILFAVGFLIAIVTAAALILKATWEIFSAIADIDNPVVTIGIGLIILVIAGLGLVILLGGSIKGNKKGFTLKGRGARL